MREPIFFRRDDTLTLEQARYWKNLLYRVVKIGTELEVAPPKGVKRPIFEEAVREAMAPSGSLESLGRYGVLNVQTEHCGIEVQIIGRHPYFWALREQYTYILATLDRLGGRVRPTCGLHFHILTPSLNEPVPEIVLANLWNLTRRYAPELKFLTSGGEKREALCRRRNHNSHLEMVKLTPGTLSMAAIQQHLRESRIVPEHQNFLNLEHLGFPEEGGVLPFHLEFRFPDMDLSPTSVTAKTFLFLAMVLKAVDLSRYGIIHVGTMTTWERKKEILNRLSNNDGNLATSDTSQVTDEMIEELRVGCRELLDLLAPAFERFEDNPALEVLHVLAETPISLLRVSGRDWEEIERLLAARADQGTDPLDEIDHRLMRCIELLEWDGFPDAKAWGWRAAWEFQLTPQELQRRLDKLDRLRGLRWDTRLGTYQFTS